MAAATEHRFSEEPLPQAVVLDADFVVNVLHEREEFHKDCTVFASRLFDENVPIVYTQLLRLEFMSGWQKAVTRGGIPANMLRDLNVSDPGDDLVRLYKLGDEYLSVFLSLYGRYEVRLSARLQDQARRYMAEYNLRPMDACLVASAHRTGIHDLASLDADFRRVGWLHLWNDHIPARRKAARRRRART